MSHRFLFELLAVQGRVDADQLYRRLQKAVSSRPLGEAGALNISAGVAELRPDDDSISFFQRADNALYGAKEAGTRGR